MVHACTKDTRSVQAMRMVRYTRGCLQLKARTLVAGPYSSPAGETSYSMHESMVYRVHAAPDHAEACWRTRGVQQHGGSQSCNVM